MIATTYASVIHTDYNKSFNKWFCGNLGAAKQTERERWALGSSDKSSRDLTVENTTCSSTENYNYSIMNVTQDISDKTLTKTGPKPDLLQKRYNSRSGWGSRPMSGHLAQLSDPLMLRGWKANTCLIVSAGSTLARLFKWKSRHRTGGVRKKVFTSISEVAGRPDEGRGRASRRWGCSRGWGSWWWSDRTICRRVEGEVLYLTRK